MIAAGRQIRIGKSWRGLLGDDNIKQGEFMSEPEARAKGYRPARNG